MKNIFKKYNNYLRTIQIVLFALFTSQLSAQTYPVQATSVLVPPYLGTISEYGTTLNEKFFVNLFTNDLTITNRQIQLKLYIQGGGFNAVSAPVINGYVPIFITGGEALQITNVDLAPYLQLQNLQGISPAQYANGLPQGTYKFCVEVLDFATQQPISLKSCAIAYFIVNDPPFLNLPTNHENVAFLNVQNIFFSWTPRHLNATNIEYEFTLVELQDNQAPSNYSFFIAQPLYQATQNNTVLLYGPAQPLLIAGKKYAWRVRAKTQSGFGETATFQNNGYSEIYDFVYQGNCDKPEFTLAQVSSTTKAKITWQPNINHQSYLVQYRKKTTDTWFDVQSTTTEVNLFDLEPQAVYEFRVGGYCAGNVLSFSNTNEFTMPNSNITAISCGIMPTVDLSNQTLLTGNLGNGQVFIAGDFPIHVTEATGNGSYSGKGWTRAPYLNSIKLAVVFTDIKINTSMQMVLGEVKAVYDPTWANVLDINELTDQVENILDVFQQDTDEHNYNVNFVITSASNITIVNGQIIVVNSATNSTGATFDFDQGEATIITDANGSVFAVSPNGTVLPQQGVGIGIPNASNTENLSSTGQVTELSNSDVKVTFSKSTVSNFESTSAEDLGATNTASDKIKSLYKIIKDGNGVDYKLYYKGVINEGKGLVSYDYVTATINTKDTLILRKLNFNLKGIKVVAVATTTSGENTIKILKVPVFNTSGKEELMALFDAGKPKKNVVGVMTVIPIKDVGIVNVTLVPVKGAEIPVNIQEQLNAIYKGTGAQFKITIAPNYTPSITTLECGTSGIFTNYTSEQNTFLSGYKTAHPTQDNEYYLFITKSITPSRPLSGFMPLHRQFGFVFSDNIGGNENKSTGVGGLAAVIAHEIGHGVFELEHPWEKFKYNKTDGTTNLLMDYAAGTTLSYPYWQTISHPKTALYLFQSDESGELSGGFALAPDFTYLKTNYDTILNGTNGQVIDNGFLPAFVTLENNIKVDYYWNSFLGKYTKNGLLSGAFASTNTNLIPALQDKIWLICSKSIENGQIKYIRTIYENIINKNNQQLQIYINSILSNSSLKRKLKENRKVYWGLIEPATSSGNNQVNGSTQLNGYSNYLNNLAQKAGTVYKPDNIPYNTPNVHLFDYTSVISDAEKQKILNELNFIKDDSGSLGKIFIIDSQTPALKKQEVTTYLNSLQGKEVGLLIDFTNKYNPIVKTFLGSQYPGAGTTTMNKYQLLLAKALEDIIMPHNGSFNPFTAMLDGLTGLIGKALIDARFYNPDLPNYNPFPAKVYSYASLSIVNDELIAFASNNNNDLIIYSYSRCQFATICGLWNGLISQIQGIPSGVSMILKIDGAIFDLILDINNARQNLRNKISAISWSTVGNMIVDEWKQATQNACVISYNVGQLTFQIIGAFIGTEESNIAVTFLNTLDKLDVVGQLIGKFAKVTSPLWKPVLTKTGKLLLQPLVYLSETVSSRLKTIFTTRLNAIIKSTATSVTICLHATNTGNFLVDNLEKTPLEFGELLAKDLRKGQKDIILLSCNDLVSAQALADASGKNVFTTNGKITIFDDGVKLDQGTNWYKLEPNSTTPTLILEANAPVKKCVNCYNGEDGVEMGVIGMVGLFGKSAISSINGFSDNLVSILSTRGLSLSDFKILQQKRYDLLSIVEKTNVDAIRNSVPMPDGGTLIQKVIPKMDIIKYTIEGRNTVGGFVSTAKDSKHLISFEDIYEGMRLDYPGTKFNLADGSCGVIRYKTPTPNLIIPKLPDVTGDLPYTGNGFTGGNNGKLGVPEWKSPYNTPTEGAEIWEVFSDGSEVLKAKFSAAQNKFIIVP